jgi:oxygen-dependent protoporphyrinogen oxidase
LRTARGAGAVTLLEATDRLGGKICTEHHDGFVIEGGPDGFLSSKPGALALCRELGLEGRLASTRACSRRAFVKRSGRLHPLPAGFSGLMPARVLPLLTSGTLSLRGGLRAGLEMLVPRRGEEGDESVGAFVRRRFGREAYDHLIEPLLSGIYAGDGDTLSLQSTFPQLRLMERTHRSVIRSLLTSSRRSAPPGGFVTLPRGLTELVETLRAQLDQVEIMTNASVHQVRRTISGYEVVLSNGDRLEGRTILLAVPADRASGILVGLDDELVSLLLKIPHVSTAIVTLAFRRTELTRVPAGHGYVSPRVEGGSIVACSISSQKFEGRAPDGALLLRCFLGRAGADGVASAHDGVLLRIVRDELKAVFAIDAPPILSRVVHWPAGLPQYTLGHAERLAGIEKRLHAFPGLQLAGASYHGIGIPDCIVSGWRAAAAVTRYLEAA